MMLDSFQKIRRVMHHVVDDETSVMWATIKQQYLPLQADSRVKQARAAIDLSLCIHVGNI